MKIEQLIEQEAFNFHSELARAEIVNFEYEGDITTDESESCVRTAETEGFQQGAQFVLSQFKWRKVEDELPEVKNNFYFILAKVDNDRQFDVLPIHQKDNQRLIKKLMKAYQVTHWMPIPEVERAP